MLTVAQRDFQTERHMRWFQMLQKAIHVEGWMSAEDIFGPGKDILNKGAGNDAQRNFAVDAAESEVVDLVAEGWDVRTLGGVDIDSQNIFSIEINVRGEIERERCVATFVFAEARAINPDSGGGHDAFEVDKNVAAGGFRWELETAAIDGDELVRLIVEAVPGGADVGVRNDNAFEGGVVELAGVRAFDNGFVETPIAIDWKDHATVGLGVGGGRRIAR